MKNSIIKIVSLLGIVLFCLQTNAQQDPQYTQYMYNMSIINPAYATDDMGTMKLGAIYRQQWAGIEGGPETVSVFAHAPLSQRVEAGISIVHDEIGGFVKENKIFADIAYVLSVSETTRFSFGVKAGVSLFDTDLTSANTFDPGVDPALQNMNEAFPNFGLGAYLFGENYYIGLSAPNVFTSTHLENESGMIALGEENIHYFLTGGYVFDLNPDLKMKPAFMVRGVEGAPLSVDITTNFLLYDRLEAGVAYRLGDAISGLVNFKVTPKLSIGYAYDYTTNNLGRFNDGSHEVLVLFDLDFLGISKGYDKSPRFF